MCCLLRLLTHTHTQTLHLSLASLASLSSTLCATHTGIARLVHLIPSRLANSFDMKLQIRTSVSCVDFIEVSWAMPAYELEADKRRRGEAETRRMVEQMRARVAAQTPHHAVVVQTPPKAAPKAAPPKGGRRFSSIF